MIDLNKHRTTSTGFLNKLSVKRSMKSNDLVYEMELTYSVENLLQAQTLNSVIGGCESAFMSHVESSENKVSIKSTINNSLWHLEFLDDDDDVCLSKMVDILNMSFNTSHIGCFLNVKIKTMKADAGDASVLAEYLGKKIKTKFENPQQLLFDVQKSTDVQNICLIGGIEAIDGVSIIGVKLSEDSNSCIIDNFGKHYKILKSDITAQIEISNTGFVDFCDNYKSSTENPDWSDVVPYIVTFSQEDDSGAISLTKDILEKIVSIPAK